MAPLDAEAQFKFLIACIKHSNAGKIDFDNVAKECEIISKGAAAKRYERLMKAHGITGTIGGGGKSPPAAGSGPSTPKTPKTPAGRKNVTNSRAISNKKRKLAASGEDVDDDDDVVKHEVKDEVKHDEDFGSYTMHPTDPQFDAAMESFVKACGGTVGGDIQGVEDEVFVLSETQRGLGGQTAVPVATPVAMVQHMFLPHPPEAFYGFVGHHHSSHLRRQSPPHAAVIAATSAPFPYDQDTDCFPQARIASENSTTQWLHQQRCFWNGESSAESGGNLAWDH